MPVLILTARGSWTDKVEGLNAGADDYLAKPFAMAELVARLNALIRRAHGHAQPEIACGGLRIDTAAQTVTLDGTPVRLTAMEFRLLECLAHHLGQPVSKTQLTEHLYGQDFDRNSNTLEVIVGRLRRKLGEAFIETVRGQGYRLSPRRLILSLADRAAGPVHQRMGGVRAGGGLVPGRRAGRPPTSSAGSTPGCAACSMPWWPAPTSAPTAAR